MNENRKRKHAGGRPKSTNPLQTDLKVRFTADDAKRIDAYCERHNTRRALAVRAAVLRMLDEDENRSIPPTD